MPTRIRPFALLLGLLLAVSLTVAGCSRRSKGPIRDRVAAGDSDALGELKEQGAAAVPKLMELMQDADPNVVVNAVNLLGGLGDAAKPAVPLLIQALKMPGVKTQAGYALRGIGKAGAEGMVSALESGDAETKKLVAEVMSGGVGPEFKAAVPALTRLVETGDAKTKTHAAMALAAIGSASESALPALRTAAETAGLTSDQKRMIEGTIKRIEDAKKPGAYTKSR